MSRKYLPQHNIVLLDDNLHTVEYTVKTIVDIFGIANDDAKSMVLNTHQFGKAIIWTGHKELAELKLELLKDRKPEIINGQKIATPLNIILEKKK
jgi:ATP-dependent Clp protease adaptor protein ClpS